MNANASIWFVRAMLALTALTAGCSGPAQTPAAASRLNVAQLQNVRFGPQA